MRKTNPSRQPAFFVRTRFAAPDMRTAARIVAASHHVIDSIGGAHDALYFVVRDGALKIATQAGVGL